MARLALVLAATLLACAYSTDAGVLKHSLLQKVQRDGTANIAIVLKTGVSSVYDAAKSQTFTQRGQAMTSIRASLIAFTSRSQNGLRTLLQSKGVAYKPFWITNRIIVKNADAALVKELSSHPDVAEVREEIVIPVAPFTKSGSTTNEPLVVRGVHKVRAHELWDQGFKGEGLIVNNIDTGVRGTHEILSANFLGDYGWFDPNSGSSQPNDQNGHGTHTMGTIAGQNGFGVAPGAKWQACVGCAGSSCSESDLLGCGEFTACPTKADGSAPDCSKAPHVTSNSWGSSLGGQDWYDDVIQGFHAAGVIPVFSAGNSGSSCSTVGSPGDRDVIGVAATDFDDTIADFSSRGPGTGGAQKPEISAPGVEVLSSVNLADNSYDRYSGTSMACPHVSGGVALLIQKNPMLQGNYTAVREQLFNGAVTTGLVGSSQTCGGIDDRTFPNMVFGHGRLDLVSSSSK